MSSRYLRLAITGTNQATPWYAEVLPCWLETATREYDQDGYELKYIEAQIENTTRFAAVSVLPLSPYPRRALKMHFLDDADAGTEMRQEIVLRSRGRAYPIAVVPVATEGVVVFGRLLTAEWAERRILRTWWNSDLALVEDAILTPLGG